jgi:hypothetical protein
MRNKQITLYDTVIISPEEIFHLKGMDTLKKEFFTRYPDKTKDNIHEFAILPINTIFKVHKINIQILGNLRLDSIKALGMPVVSIFKYDRECIRFLYLWDINLSFTLILNNKKDRRFILEFQGGETVKAVMEINNTELYLLTEPVEIRLGLEGVI